MIQKSEFIRFMLECQVLQFGDFTTKSGRKTPYFINTGLYKTGRQLARLGEFYADKIWEVYASKNITNIFGPAYKGIPIGTSTSEALYRKYGLETTVSFNRKEMKDHGEGGWLLGHSYGKTEDKDRVLIVEDVTTAGTSIRENLPGILKYPNTEVLGLVVSVDRMEKGKGDLPALVELQKEFGIETHSIIDFNDLLDFLKQDEKASSQLSEYLPKMLEYREKYGVVPSL